MALRSVRFGVQSTKLSNVGHWMGDQKFTISSSGASEGTLSRWSRLRLKLLDPTNPHWTRVVGCGPFSLCVIHKEGLVPSSGDINRLMMMIMMIMILLFKIRMSVHCISFTFWAGYNTVFFLDK
jgi:hypothetical protein